MKERKDNIIPEHEGTEIIVSEGTQDLSVNVNRVDFSEPTTILSYGDESKTAISGILESTAKLSVAGEEMKLDDKQITAITSFDKSLDESEKKSAKNELVLIKKAKSLLTRLGVNKFEEDKRANSYQGRYEEYCRIIEEVCKVVESQKQGALSDIELRKSIIEEMTPYVEQLEMELMVGKQDLKAFYDEIELLKQGEQTQDVIYEIQYKTQLAEVFNTKLNELEKAIALYKEQIQSYRMQQKTDMELVMQNDSYLRDQAPVLKAQGSVMVFNRQQEERISTAVALNAATNQAIRNNAEQLEQNVAAIVDLSINGGVTVDTLKSLQDSISRGVQLFKDGRKKKQARIDSDRRALEVINDSLDKYKTELNELLETNEIIKDYTPTPNAKRLRYDSKN